jgi:hypothetical protein
MATIMVFSVVRVGISSFALPGSRFVRNQRLPTEAIYGGWRSLARVADYLFVLRARIAARRIEVVGYSIQLPVPPVSIAFRQQ